MCRAANWCGCVFLASLAGMLKKGASHEMNSSSVKDVAQGECSWWERVWLV